MFILNLWGEIRELFLRLDMIAFSYIDNVYELFKALASESLISDTIIKHVLNNIYVLVGIFAFFRIALLLVNSIINPGALQKEGAGLSKIFVNTLIMMVLLVFTPTLFQISRDLASEIVENNYIQRLFININDSDKKMEPGYEMQRIAIGAVISPDESYVNDNGYPNDNCDDDCKEALQCLNEINGVTTKDEYKVVDSTGCIHTYRGAESVAWGKLADYNGVAKGKFGSKVYVYNYRPLILTIVGWTITYILLSFTFDVAKRMIELAILEIVSPLFIATIVDPKSMQSGPFKKWLKTLGNSYASLFIRIAAVSLILLCVRVLSYWHPEPAIGVRGKIIVLIAFLIFFKQLPKWFSNMLGMDGDGTGLGSLGIGKKIGGAALIGGLATKAGHGAAGAARTIVGNATAEARASRKIRKENKDNGEYQEKLGTREARRNVRNEAATAAKAEGKGRFSQWKAGKDALNAEKARYGANYARRAASAIAIGAVEGAKVGAKADSLKGAFTAGKGVVGTARGGSLGYDGKTLGSMISGGIGERYDSFVDKAYGDSLSREEIADKVKKRKDREAIYNSSAVRKAGINLDDLAVGFNDVKNLGAANTRDLITMNYANAKGYDAEYIGEGDNRKLQIKDSSGNILSNDDVLRAGSSIMGAAGIAQLSTLQNKVTSNALQESGNNAQIMNQLASTISNLQHNIRDISIPGLNAGQISINGTSMRLDKDSITSLRNANEEAMRQINIERRNLDREGITEEQKNEINSKLDILNQQSMSFNQAEQMLVMKNQLNTAVTELGNLQNRQSIIQPIIDNIGKVEYDPNIGEFKNSDKKFANDTDRETYLSKQNEKYQKIIDAAKAENKDSK